MPPIQVSRDEDSREFVAALARGLRVIEAFTGEAPAMTLSEVARATDSTPATARRSLLTLEALGYVQRVGRRFVLTARVLALGGAYADSMNLREVAQPFLQRLVDRFHDSASMTILHGNEVVYLAHVAGPGAAFARHFVGARLPAHATSTGQVLLAHLTPARRAAFLAQAPFPRYTSRTPTDRAALEQILATVRRRGHAVVQDTVEYGATALAVPVRSAAGAVIAAANTSASSARVDASAILARLDDLRRAAASIEGALVRFPALAHSAG